MCCVNILEYNMCANFNTVPTPQNNTQSLWDSAAVNASPTWHQEDRQRDAQRRAEAAERQRVRAWGSGAASPVGSSGGGANGGGGSGPTLAEIQSEQAKLDLIQREQNEAKRKIMEAQQAAIATFGEVSFGGGVRSLEETSFRSRFFVYFG